MRIDLGLPVGQSQRQFLDQLNASLRSMSSASTGSGGFDEAGCFRASTTSTFTLSGGESTLTITAIFAKDSVLEAIEIEPTGTEPPIPSWREEMQRFVTTALAAALAEKQQSFFQRGVLFYVGAAMDGEYWLQGYRFAPAFPADPEPTLLNAERAVVIDMNVKAVDLMHAFAVSDEAVRRHASRLSFLLRIGLYRQPHSQVWVIPTSEGVPQESIRASRGFWKKDISASEMPKKGILCPPGRFEASIADPYRYAGRLLSMPRETRRLLRAIDASPPYQVDAFDRCARLFQVALVCEDTFSSVGLAYRVAGVEALVQAIGTYRGFSDFVRAHVKPRPDLESVLDFLYGQARSAHFHGGEFPSGEFARGQFFDPLLDAQQVQRSETHRQGYQVLQEAVVAWMSQIVGPDDSQPVDA